MNREKSCFYPSKWVQGHRLTRVARRLGCSAKRFPLIYLGASLIKGRCKGIYFEDLVNKFANPITGWKAKFISFAGKAKSPNPHTLLLSNSKKNHCSNRGTYESIPVESIRPASHPWVSWEKVTTSPEEGGLAIRKITDTVYGLHGKLAWSIFSGDSRWARLLFQKYGLQSVHGNRRPQPNSSRL